MHDAAKETVTRALVGASSSQGGAASPIADQLLPIVYEELRRLASGQMRREAPGHTLQTTALVNEAYLRLVDADAQSWNSRAHFVRIAARAMRQVLIDHARGRRAQKRGGDWIRTPLDENAIPSDSDAIDVLALDEAMQHLAELDPLMAQVVELRFFGGLNVQETAKLLDISPTTVKREWRAARAWLLSEIADEDRADGC